MKKIPLTQGKFALVDDCDYERLVRYKWHVGNTTGGNWYAFRSGIYKDGIQRHIAMGREILNAKETEQVDYRTGNTLDNTRGNIRLCDNMQKKQNSKKHATYCGRQTSSKFKGVCWHKGDRIRKGRWQASITVEKKRVCLGSFQDEKLAATAYDEAAMENFGEFARTNF
jgi:hypothetical protein